MAARFDLVFEEHAGFTLAFQWVLSSGPPPVLQDFTGWTAKLQIRQLADEASPVLSEKQTGGLGIVLGGVAGTVQITWTKVDVDALALVFENEAHYDLVLTPPAGEPVRLLEGRVHMKAGVTT